MPNKYELTAETKIVFGKTLYRVRALIEFANVDVGEFGGWVEREENLSQEGDAWVYGDAWVSGDARVYGNARVYGDAWVYGNAEILKAEHILFIGPVGSRNAHTTFYRTKSKRLEIVCGCFLGGVDKFLSAVAETHGDSKHAKVYRAAVEIAKLQIEDVEG